MSDSMLCEMFQKRDEPASGDASTLDQVELYGGIRYMQFTCWLHKGNNMAIFAGCIVVSLAFFTALVIILWQTGCFGGRKRFYCKQCGQDRPGGDSYRVSHRKAAGGSQDWTKSSTSELGDLNTVKKWGNNWEIPDCKRCAGKSAASA